MASTIDIPQQVKSEITLFEVETLHCSLCGCVARRGGASDLAIDEYGATAHRVGPRIKALGFIAPLRFSTK